MPFGIHTAAAQEASIARSYESAGKLPRFSYNGADVANASMLKAVVQQVAYRNEIILLCGDGQSGGSPNALNTALQFYALNLRHVLFVSDTAHSCERLRAGLPDLACVWSSRVPRTKPENDGGCVRRFWDMRFYFYDVRKHMVSQLAGVLGVNVLQTDTDVAWFSNPYGTLKTGDNGRANLLAQWDAPLVNAGVFYAQGLRPGDAATWVLAELHRRIALFMYNPDAVLTYVTATAYCPPIAIAWCTTTSWASPATRVCCDASESPTPRARPVCRCRGRSVHSLPMRTSRPS